MDRLIKYNRKPLHDTEFGKIIKQGRHVNEDTYNWTACRSINNCCADAFTGEPNSSTDIIFTYKIQCESDAYEVLKVVEGQSGIPAEI